MSEEQKKTNFWTTLPGILTGMAGLIGAIATLITAHQKLTENSTGDSTQIAAKTENFEVYADSKNGKQYTNKKDDFATINFTATGEWLAIPEDIDNSAIPDTAKGYISPKGDPNFYSNDNVPCPRYPLVALIVMSEEGRCLAHGEKGSFELKKGETAYFLMNDVETLYGDNKGSVNVELSIE